MKNAYAVKLQERKRAEVYQNTKEGFEFGLNLCAVALNNKFGFGNDRLAVLETEIERMLEEEFGGDVETASYGLARRIAQIRGKNHNC